MNNLLVIPTFFERILLTSGSEGPIIESSTMVDFVEMLVKVSSTLEGATSEHMQLRSLRVRLLLLSHDLESTNSRVRGGFHQTTVLPGQGREDPFQILGLAECDDIEKIKRAYRHKLMEWHPDRLHGKAPELLVCANQQTSRLNAAFYEIRSKLNG